MKRISLSKLASRAMADKLITRREAQAIAGQALANGKVSKAEARVATRLLSSASSFEAGARPVIESLVRAPGQLPFPAALTAAASLGREIQQLRVGLGNNGSNLTDPAVYGAQMATAFGPKPPALPSEADPPAGPNGFITGTSNWGSVSPYPTVRVSLDTGNFFVRDAAVSDKWFGPYTPAAGARVVGQFDDEQRAKLARVLLSSFR